MDYSQLSKEELIKIIELLNGRLEVHNKRIKELHSDRGVKKIEISNIENYWKQIHDTLPVLVSLHNCVGYTSLNKYGQFLSEYTEDEWINMPEEERALIFEFPAKPETLIFFDMFTQQGKDTEKDSVELEMKLKTKTGKWLWLHTTNSYIYNPLKNDFDILSAALDITDRKNHEMEIERLNGELELLLERERKSSHEKEQLYKKQIEEKNRELSNLALYLTERSECLLKLKDQAIELSNATESEIKEKAMEIVKSIETKLNGQNAWLAFQVHFESLHPKYFQTLHESYPDLTQMELKVCSLVKLDLSTKAISTILNLSPRTVDAHRYNIRNKMKLNQEDQLSVFLNTIQEN